MDRQNPKRKKPKYAFLSIKAANANLHTRIGGVRVSPCSWYLSSTGEAIAVSGIDTHYDCRSYLHDDKVLLGQATKYLKDEPDPEVCQKMYDLYTHKFEDAQQPWW